MIKTFLQLFKVSLHPYILKEFNVSTIVFIVSLLTTFSRVLMSILNCLDPSFNGKKQLITLTLFPVLVSHLPSSPFGCPISFRTFQVDVNRASSGNSSGLNPAGLCVVLAPFYDLDCCLQRFCLSAYK